MSRQTPFVSLISAMACAVLVMSCGNGEETAGSDIAGARDQAAGIADAGPVYGGELIVGLEAEFGGLRPWEDACAASCLNVMHALYDVLMQQTASGEYEGFLAESIEPNSDFTVWTLTLRPGITFSNGTPLTAQTIADMFPVQRTGRLTSGAVKTMGIVAVEATSELVVTYRLDAPNSAFPSALQRPALGAPFIAELLEADPDRYIRDPVGTGPFVFESRDRDNETVMVRRENYWRKAPDGRRLPYLDRIRFRPIPDEGTRLDSLLSGTVDAMVSMREATARDARLASGIRRVEFIGDMIGGGFFNTASPPLDDRRVRRGLTRMVDQARVIDAMGGVGVSSAGTQWFAPGSRYWTQAAAESYQSFDFEKGKAELRSYVDDPGRSDGKAPGEPISVALACPPDPTLIAAMQVIEQVWSGSGLADVSLKQFDQATHIANALDSQFEAHCWRFGSEDDPGYWLNIATERPEIAKGNLSNYYSPAMREAAVAAIRTDDFEARKALFSKIMVEMNEEALLWYHGHTVNLIATQKNVGGVGEWSLPSGSPGMGLSRATTMWSDVYIAR